MTGRESDQVQVCTILQSDPLAGPPGQQWKHGEERSQEGQANPHGGPDREQVKNHNAGETEAAAHRGADMEASSSTQ